MTSRTVGRDASGAFQPTLPQSSHVIPTSTSSPIQQNGAVNRRHAGRGFGQPPRQRDLATIWEDADVRGRDSNRPLGAARVLGQLVGHNGIKRNVEKDNGYMSVKDTSVGIKIEPGDRDPRNRRSLRAWPKW